MTAAETPSAAGATDLGRAPLEEVLAALRVDAQTGLSDAEVEARLRQYGANEVPEQKVHPLGEFLKKFWGLSAWMLELIIVISWLLGKCADLVIVSALLLVNALARLVQERRASGVIDTLRRRLQVTARVRRTERAVSVVAGECGIGPPGLIALEDRARDEAEQGYRVLAVARGRRGHHPRAGRPPCATTGWRSRCSREMRFPWPRKKVGLATVRRVADLKDSAEGVLRSSSSRRGRMALPKSIPRTSTR